SLLGHGDGTFDSPINSGPIQEPNNTKGLIAGALAVGDFNGDGLPDAAVADENSGGRGIDVLTGAGNGTLTSSALLTPAGPGVFALGTAALTGNGHVDLVGASPSGNLFVYRSDFSTFVFKLNTATPLRTQFQFSFTVRVADVFGNTDPNYKGTVHFASSDKQ